MALKSAIFDDLLRFASTSRSKSTVTLAAVSFAVCHLVVMGTGSAAAGGSADLQAEIDPATRTTVSRCRHFACSICRGRGRQRVA